MWFFHTLFAGLWPLVLHLGFGVLLVIGLCLGAWFSPIFKQGFFGAAVVAIGALLFSFIGVHDEANRCKAQSEVIQQEVNAEVAAARQAVQTAPSNPAPVHWWVRPSRHRDKWNSKNY